VDVYNRGNIKDTLQFESPSKPKPWEISIGFNGTDMQPGEHRNAWLNITSMQSISPRIEEFNFTMRSKSNPNASDFLVVQVDLLELKLAKVYPPEDLSGRPGDNVTYICRLVNLGNVKYNYSLYAESNSEWPSMVLKDNSSGIIELSGSVEFTVILSIPDGTPVGTVDNMGIWVYDNSGNGFMSALINTTVLPQTAFDLLSDKNEVTIETGGTHSFKIIVINTGNVNITVSLAVTGEKAPWATLSHSSVTIAAGKNKEEYLIITIPKSVEGKYTIYLEATSGSDNKTRQFDVNVRRDMKTNYDDDSTVSDTMFIGIIIFIILIVVIAIIGILLLFKRRKKYEEEWPVPEEQEEIYPEDVESITGEEETVEWEE
jgi:uncharacterized membrane protein